MALKRPRWKPGTVVTLEHASSVLKDNPLGDPHVRKLALWLPPQYDAGAGRGRGRRFPVLFDLVGFTGSGLAHVAWKSFSDNVPERAARLVHEGRMGPAILVFPDCFTALGGNQYVNSSAIGRYADYLTRELVPFVDREFRTLASREHRGCFGKSSGGYGAMLHGMKYASSCGAQRLPPAVQPRDGRSAPGALAAVAAARPGAARRALQAQPQVAARHLHRLRLARPVPHPLRLAHPLAAPARGRDSSRLRRIRRRSLRY